MGWITRDVSGQIDGWARYPSPSSPNAIEVDDNDPEVASFNASTDLPEVISDRQFFQELAALGEISQDEALAAVQIGAIPARLATAINTLPAQARFSAKMQVSGAVTFHRHHPTTLALAQAMSPPWSSDQLDTLWAAAALL